jgi:short-subunit dehydrogenase
MKKNILITGAASGIGKATTDLLLKKGYNVFAIDILKVDEKPNLTSFTSDITNEEKINQIVKYFEDNNIILHSIVNVAGIHKMASLIETNYQDLKKLIDINLLGTMNINNKFHRFLNEKGRIIIITSEVAPFDPLPFNGLYNISKTALDSYAQALRQELNLLNQKVITIRPGSIKTPLSDGSLLATEELATNTVLYKKQANKFLKLTKKFMGKTIEPIKVAKLIIKVLEKKNPKIIYRINLNILLSLLNILPKTVQCFIIKYILK